MPRAEPPGSALFRLVYLLGILIANSIFNTKLNLSPAPASNPITKSYGVPTMLILSICLWSAALIWISCRWGKFAAFVFVMLTVAAIYRTNGVI